MFLDGMCKLTQVCKNVCPDAVISGRRALEEQVWNVLQRSGMSVALDPWRLLLDGHSSDREHLPFLLSQSEEATEIMKNLASMSCVGVEFIYTKLRTVQRLRH